MKDQTNDEFWHAGKCYAVTYRLAGTDWDNGEPDTGISAGFESAECELLRLGRWDANGETLEELDWRSNEPLWDEIEKAIEAEVDSDDLAELSEDGAGYDGEPDYYEEWHDQER